MEALKINNSLDLFSTPQYLRSSDIMKLFGVGATKASSIIRSIKSVSDVAGISGRVTVSDYIAWYNRYLQKKEENEMDEKKQKEAEELKRARAKKTLGMPLTERENALIVLYGEQ